MSSSNREQAYYVLMGYITDKGKEEMHVLGPENIICIVPHEERQKKVNGNECASTPVIIVDPQTQEGMSP